MSTALYFAVVLYCHPDSNLSDQGAPSPREKYIRGWILALTRKIDLGFCNLTPKAFTEAKTVKLVSIFDPSRLI